MYTVYVFGTHVSPSRLNEQNKIRRFLEQLMIYSKVLKATMVSLSPFDKLRVTGSNFALSRKWLQSNRINTSVRQDYIAMSSLVVAQPSTPSRRLQRSPYVVQFIAATRQPL